MPSLVGSEMCIRDRRCSVAQSLKDALVIDSDLEQWLAQHPTQALCSSIQCDWASRMDAALDGGSLEGPSQVLVSRLAALSSATSSPLKRAQLIVELAQQRDCTQSLHDAKSSQDHRWLRQLRLYCTDETADVVEGSSFLEQLIKGNKTPLAVTCVARVAGASLTYGYEYQGIGRRLIRTQLTDRCFCLLYTSPSPRD